MANASQLLEGKNYPTGNLVLPCLYGCIAATASDADVLQPWDGAILKSCDLHPTVAEARADMHHDLVRRWVTDLSDEKLRLYSISSLCDASLRRLAFPGMTTDTREKAMQWFRQEYDSTYAPPAPPTVGAVAEPPPATPLPVYAQTGLGSFLGFMTNMKSVTTHPQPSEPAVSDAPSTPETLQNEVDVYFGLPDVPLGTDPLLWWPKHEKKLPNLSRMARQFLSCPASSASAERVFSLAGRLYNDYAQNLTEQNLEERMWAKINRHN